MRRLFMWGSLSSVCLAVLASGCDNGTFAPPRRAKSSSTANGAGESKPTFLVMVVPGTPNELVQSWGLRAQHEANDKRAIFRVMGPMPGKPDSEQPESVRQAVHEGASALIVYPGDSPELPKALAEAEAKGVPVVLLNKRIAAPEGAKPFTVVEYGPFDASAKQIVAATLEDLKKHNRPVDGTAIILVGKVVDSTSARRAAALKAAAEAAKFAKVVTVEFDNTNPATAQTAALEAIKANPDVSVMLAVDGEGLTIAASSRSESKGKPVFFVGGYTDFGPSQIITPPERESCYVEGRYIEMGAQAVLAALARFRGETLGERVEPVIRFVRTEAAVSTPANPNSSFLELKPNLPVDFGDRAKAYTPPTAAAPKP